MGTSFGNRRTAPILCYSVDPANVNRINRLIALSKFTRLTKLTRQSYVTALILIIYLYLSSRLLATWISDTLQAVQVPVIPRAKCNQIYGPGYILESNICAGYVEGGKDACSGNSGGPLVTFRSRLVPRT